MLVCLTIAGEVFLASLSGHVPGLRSVVEQIFSHVRLWRAADAKFKQSPELQEMVLLVIYSLVQLKNRTSPPRPSQALVGAEFPADL